MRRILMLLLVISTGLVDKGQSTPCTTDPTHRQFDFWIGEWDVYAANGKKAGDSKIELILDSCVILENWKSANASKGIFYSGKSLNTYNSATKQWQQTWVDNVGGTTEFLEGHYENDKMILFSKSFQFNKDTMAIRRLTFHNLELNRARQHGEISKDKGVSWITEYDLEYRRKKK